MRIRYWSSDVCSSDLYLPQAEATAINFLAPLIMLALAPWVLKEPARLSRWAAAGVGFLGVLIIIRPDAGLDPIGTLFVLLTALMFAGQYIATWRGAADEPFTTLVWRGGVGSGCLPTAFPFILPSIGSASCRECWCKFVGMLG